MKLKLDENLSRYLKPILGSLGHDVMTAAEVGLLSQPDRAVETAARSEGRLLLTLDLEFADLREYPPGSHPGAILFRPGTMGFRAVNHYVESFVRQTDLTPLAGCVAVVGPDRVRVRRPKSDKAG